MEKDKETIEFTDLSAAIEFVDNKGAGAEKSVKGYHQAFFELTGFRPDHRVNALDVVKIFNNLSDSSND